MGRIIIAIIAACAVLGLAVFAYAKLTGSPAKPAAPVVTQKSSAPPQAQAPQPNETQTLGLTFDLLDAGAPYALTINTVAYTDLLDTSQNSTATVSGMIVDAKHPIAFWQKPKRFQLLNQAGQPYAAKITVRAAKGGFSYMVVFSKVSTAALKSKQVNFVVPTPPQLLDGATSTPGEPIVVGIVPDRFRFGS